MNYFCYLKSERFIFFVKQPLCICSMGIIRLYLALFVPDECLLTVMSVVPLTFFKMNMNVGKVFK